jgi:uroporphyrinogen-III synthase
MRRLFVLRPEPGAGETVARAQAQGLDAVSMPLFQVEPVPWEVPDAGSFDALLLTSANAVIHAGEHLTDLRGLPVQAVGEATAEAARKAGFDIGSTGDSGVDRLLGSIEAELRLLHLCGEHRRGPDNPRQQIRAIPVYRSAELQPPAAIETVAGQCAAIHSPRAAERLASLLGERGIDKASVRLACISEAAAKAAGEGWDDKKTAGKPTDEALLALAAALCDKPDHR